MNVHQFPERIVTPAALEHPYGPIRALEDQRVLRELAARLEQRAAAVVCAVVAVAAPWLVA